MTSRLRLHDARRVLEDENGQPIRVSGTALRDDRLEPFASEIVNLMLFTNLYKEWTGNRFEYEMMGIPLFMRRINNIKMNGWGHTYGGTGTEFGRADQSWKLFTRGFDFRQIHSERLQKIIDIGWQNLTMNDDFDFGRRPEGEGYEPFPEGLACFPRATIFQGDMDQFAKDMLIVKLFTSGG